MLVILLFLFKRGKADLLWLQWFLTDDEKRMVNARYALDPHWGIDDEFSWGAIINVLKDPKFYCL